MIQSKSSAFRNIIFFLLVISTNSAISQYVPRAERGSANADRRSEISANSVNTSIYNFGFQGRTGAGQGVPFEWPKGTGRDYLALSGMFIGGEVTDTSGNTIHIVGLPAFRSNPQNGSSWNFEPVPVYLNPSSGKVASSDDPTTWPSSWPDKMNDVSDPGWAGSWNGLLGKSTFINGAEFYYHFADDNYSRYGYFPDSTDLTRKGLGIVVSQRVLEWNDFILKDAVITVSDIYNAGTQDISNAALTMWIADFVGGDGDSQDDFPSYNLTQNTLYFNDADGVSSNPAFAGVHVGTPALAFLQTPQNLGITNLQYLSAGAINFNSTPDSYFWNTFMMPGSFYDPNSIGVGEHDIFASCGLFSLPAGSSKRVITAIVFSDDSLGDQRKINYLKGLVAGNFSPHSLNVSIASPAANAIVSGSTPVIWSAGAGTSANIDIFYSSNAGDSWNLTATREPNDGSFTWMTDSLSDGVFYQTMIVAYDSTGLGYQIKDSSFTINNPGNAEPQIRLNKSLQGQFYAASIPLSWSAGDADGGPVQINLYYRTSPADTWTPFASALPNTGAYDWDISSLPNGKQYSIKAQVSDGALTGIDTTLEFEIRNPRYQLSDTSFTERLCFGTGAINVHIADTNSLTGHVYRVQFNELGMRYDVIDEHTSQTVAADVHLTNNLLEGPIFDGIRLVTKNDSFQINARNSMWTDSTIYDYQVQLYRYEFHIGTPDTADFDIIMGNDGVDTSTEFRESGFTLPARPVNFHVLNRTSGLEIPFSLVPMDGNDGRYSATPSGGASTDEIILLRSGPGDTLSPSWIVSMKPVSGGRNPAAGDTLRIRFDKPFKDSDTYRFEAIRGNLLSVGDKSGLARDFVLYQNYPNPFNPTTSIVYELPNRTHVSLKIFNVLGQEIADLVNEVQEPGTKKIAFDGSTLSSGVYFYRLHSGNHVTVKKLILVR